MKGVSGNADRYLASGIYSYELANAAEIMRNHPSFDVDAMKELLLNVFYPMNDAFLKNHNDAHIGNYWANWDLCNIASMMSIGIFCDRENIYNQALTYYKTGLGNGSLYNTMPYVYEDGTAQWQEAGRGSVRPVYSMVYNHYVNRKGLSAPTLKAILYKDYTVEE